MVRNNVMMRWFLSRAPGARRQWPVWLSWAGCMLLLLPLVLAACNDAPPPNGTLLNQLHWCDKPTTLFQDASQSPPTALTDWKQVKGDLAFTVYLPERLPDGSCLVSGHAIVHDKVLGSMFSISYELPNGTPLALSETAVSGQSIPNLECSPDTSNPGSQLCLGTKGQTSIVISSKKSEKDLQALFKDLQPNVDWLPKK